MVHLIGCIVARQWRCRNRYFRARIQAALVMWSTRHHSSYQPPFSLVLSPSDYSILPKLKFILKMITSEDIDGDALRNLCIFPQNDFQNKFCWKTQISLLETGYWVKVQIWLRGGFVFTRPPTERMEYKVSFEVEFRWFEFRAFVLWEWLPKPKPDNSIYPIIYP